MTCWRMVARPDMAQTLNSKSPDRKQPGKKLNNNKTLSPQLSNNLDREWEREGEIIVSLYNKLHHSIFWVNNPLLNPKEVEINVLRFFLSWVYRMLCELCHMSKTVPILFGCFHIVCVKEIFNKPWSLQHSF